MKIERFILATGLIVCLMTFGSEALSLSYEFTRIVDTQTAIPDSTGTFSNLYAPLADGANIVFEGWHESAFPGIYLFNGSSLSRVIDKNTLIPEGNGCFEGFLGRDVSGSRVVLGAYSGSYQEGVYLFDGSALIKVADENTPMPQGPGNFTGFFIYDFSQYPWVSHGLPKISASHVAFYGEGEGRSGIFLFNGTDIVKIADNQTLVPGGSGNFRSFKDLDIDGSNLVFDGYDESLCHGIYFFSGSTLGRVADANTQVPEGKGCFKALNAFRISGANVVFEGIDETDQSGIYLFNGATLSKVADTKTVVPERQGYFYGFRGERISGSNVVFGAILESYEQGIYFSNGITLTKIADENTLVPEGSGYFDSFSGMAIDGSNVLFAGCGDNEHCGVYLFSGATLSKLVDTSTLIPGGVGYFTDFEVVGLNGANAVFMGYDELGQKGIYLAKPKALSTISLATGSFDGGKGDSLIAVDSEGKIHYTKNLQDWQDVPGILAQIASGAFYGGGKDGLAGVTVSGQIFYTLDLTGWNYMWGQLAQLTCCDLNGDGRDDLAGLTSSGQIYYSLDLVNWNQMWGQLAQLSCGDLNGDGRDDLAGVTSAGQIFYSLDLINWNQMWGQLAQLSCGDLNGDGRDDLAGVTGSGQIFYSLDLSSWRYMWGNLSQLSVGDLNGDGKGDLVGFVVGGDIYYTLDFLNWQWVSGKF